LGDTRNNSSFTYIFF